MNLDRRDLLVLGGAVLAAPALAQTTAPAAPANRPGTHAPKPLPFDPKKLKGLSEKLLTSHHENNYGGAVKNLNKVEAELSSINKDTAGFVVAGLKERELLFRNSMVLHELYFENLGGDGKATGAIQTAASSTFGSFARLEEILRATAMSEAGGSGWTVLGLCLHTGALQVSWSGNHTQGPASTLPLLVIDMYEHAYALDHGAAAAKYIDAFFANVRWDVVDRRLASAQKVRAVLTP